MTANVPNVRQDADQFTGHSLKSDDVGMLALRWQPSTTLGTAGNPAPHFKQTLTRITMPRDS
jgi:hypothetical protein